jgi:hypothetical protein
MMISDGHEVSLYAFNSLTFRAAASGLPAHLLFSAGLLSHFDTNYGMETRPWQAVALATLVTLRPSLAGEQSGARPALAPREGVPG